jgi:tRNA G18 (ribose-2'-O)-methylase SpoU
LCGEHPTVVRLIEFAMSNKECSKFRLKCESSYLLGRFDAVKDFTIHWIFYRLPSIGEFDPEELLPAVAFLRAAGTTSGWRIPLGPLDDDEVLKDISSDNSGAQTIATVECEPTAGTGTANCLQKKIIPWQQMLFDADFDFATAGADETSGRPANDLILVCSLLDKPTNLGGLCRSAEIFNIRCLVVSSLRVKEDPAFITLAVSADKWLPIEEVRPAELLQYLRDRQADGYTLIGLEQTTNSQSLHGLRYPKRSLIVLGNERYGMPADFLQAMDVCVEIPQYGFTRSMNVHVSASLCLYEYTKQWT